MSKANRPISDATSISRRDTADTASTVGRPRQGLKKTHKLERRAPFDCVALLLQGGGAVGAYQAGIYEALSEADLYPDWVAGISIGGINSAIIAGNPREHRVARLREFWKLVTSSPFALGSDLGSFLAKGDTARTFANSISAAATSFLGVPGFYAPRIPTALFQPAGTLEATSVYDTNPLKSTLGHLIDFDLLNSDRNDIRLSLGSVNVRTGRLVYFDTTIDVIRAEHVMASGALPPAFPAIEIDGQHYWDGGLVSNTPLNWLARNHPPDTLAFQVDLWPARGAFPKTMLEAITRMKAIANSSRTVYYTGLFEDINNFTSALSRFLDKLPEEFKRGEDAEYLMSVARRRLYHLVNLVYQPTSSENGSSEDDFSGWSVEDRWRAGYRDAVYALRHPEVFERTPGRDSGIFVFDFLSGRD
jgi:NTE family protein